MITTQTNPHHLPLPERIENPIQRDAATFLETSAQSGGARTLLALEVAPGGGNDLHAHMSYSETFRATQGCLTVALGDATHVLAPGESMTVPPGVMHAWSNPGDEPVLAEVELRPGQTGFEHAVRVAYGLARDGRTTATATPRNPLALALLLAWSDIRLPGAAARAAPALDLLARIARRTGTEQRLLRAYVPGSR